MGGAAFSIWREKHTRGDVRPLNELKITFYSTFRLALSHTCLYIYIYKSAEISKHVKSWESTFDKVRVAYVREISCSVFLTASLREDGNVLHDLVQCDFTNSPDEEKKKKQKI